MAKAIINPGICNFTTTVTATSEDGQTVSLKIETTCPNITKSAHQLDEMDALTETFAKLHETTVYKTLSKTIPHSGCPVYSGILKAVEVAAGLALPGNVSITIEK